MSFPVLSLIICLSMAIIITIICFIEIGIFDKQTIIDGNVISNSNIGNSFIGNSNIGGNQVSIDCEDEVEIVVDGKTLTKVKAKKVVFKGNAKKVNGAQFNIEGNVSGNVDGTNVTITGDVDGDVDGTNITVKGTVSGDIDGTNVIVKN